MFYCEFFDLGGPFFRIFDDFEQFSAVLNARLSQLLILRLQK